MKILILYATTEGQTRKIVQFAADHLADAGHAVELLPAGEAAELDISRFGAAILAGSVHVGRYQPELVEAARVHAAAFSGMKTLFLSVSLAAAGDDPGDLKGLKECVARFAEKTGWTPERVEHVAGAFRFTQYDFFRSWAMRWIAAQKGESVDPHADKEYTDWQKLAAVLDDWIAG
ncbi:MAG: flavodoxin domain-containing protein [Paracoccaceae bacterium]